MSVHYVFSAECNHALTWQAVGLFSSHRRLRHKSNITRLLACSEEQLQTYRGLDIGPTFVHPNLRFAHPLVEETGYPSYNKPASVMFWLQTVQPEEEFIALLDTDMLLRYPLDPHRLGARRGVVVSAEYSYLVGTEPPFASRFLSPEEVPLAAQCGGFHIFHREDIRRIAPLWLNFTREVRAFAHANLEVYMNESFLNWRRDQATLPPEEAAVRRNQALWQAEMYGYAFAAARAGVSTVVRLDTMLYPGYVPHGGLPPSILHYGSDYKLQRHPGSDETLVYFNKMNQKEMDVFACGPPFFFFDAPSFSDLWNRSARDLLCVEHLEQLNTALCGFYATACAEPPTCPPQMDGLSLSVDERCHDQHALCRTFAATGECASNPLWMLSHCPHSCGVCDAFEQQLLRPLIGQKRLIAPGAPPVPGPAAGAERMRVFFSHLRHRHEFNKALRKLAAEQNESGLLIASGARIRFGSASAFASPTPLDAGADASADVDADADASGGAGAGEGSCDAAAAAADDSEEQSSVTPEVEAGSHASGRGGDRGHSSGGGGGGDGARGEAATATASAPRPLRGVVGMAAFGSRSACTKLVGRLVHVGNGCAAPDADVRDAVALAVRGVCTFKQKAIAMQAAGAAALIVYERKSGSGIALMVDDATDGVVSIPTWSIAWEAANELLQTLALESEPVEGDGEARERLETHVEIEEMLIGSHAAAHAAHLLDDRAAAAAINGLEAHVLLDLWTLEPDVWDALDEARLVVCSASAAPPPHRQDMLER